MKITLNYPFYIGGNQVTEIEYDPSSFTVREYHHALKAIKRDPSQMSNPLNDYEFHFALGVGIILASNKGKGWSYEDFDRLINSDIWQVSAIGLGFFGGKPEEAQETTSEGQSTNTPSDTTLQ